MDEEETVKYAKADAEATEAMFTGVHTIKNIPVGDRRIETFEDGIFDIQFVGDDRPRRMIPIKYAVVDIYGLPRYLVGPDGTIWNWSTIIRAKRVADA